MPLLPRPRHLGAAWRRRRHLRANSSSVIAKALAADPYLAFEPGRWAIRKRHTPVEYFSSPMDYDDGGTTWADVAYIGRVLVRDKPVLVVMSISHSSPQLPSLQDSMRCCRTDS